MPAAASIAIVVSIFFVAGLLFLRPYITEIKIIDRQELWLVQKTFNGSAEKTIAVADIDKLVLRRRRGKVAGAFFKLYTKSGKRYWIIRIPAVYLD